MDRLSARFLPGTFAVLSGCEILGRFYLMSFWQQLPKPVLVLAPMADVTDAAFRRMIAKYSSHVRADGTIGGPDVFWTEFVSADGLARATPEGKEKLMADLIYAEEERPIVAQLFSSNEEYMESAAALCRELGFDGIDINMGCPHDGIERQGCGAAMIKNPTKARAIIRAAKRGAGDLPVSVKTRVGYNQDELETWLPELLAENPAVITVHARTRKEMSKVPARWERVAKAVEIRNELGSETLIFGNGDVLSVEDARAKAKLSHADGMMLGRAIFGNPWLYHPEKDLSNVSLEERFEALLEHTKLFEELLPHKNFAIMKKHYKAYVNGFPGAVELRAELMEVGDSNEIEAIIHSHLQK
ncbi:MAG: tRNA-dihydrouridine synthase [Candidatus Paceibacterota bacterium]